MTTLKLRKKLTANDQMVFYDDMPHHIDAFHKAFPLIKAIKVPSKLPYSPILKGKSRILYPLEYLKKYPTNTYAKYIIKKLNDKSQIMKDNFSEVIQLDLFRNCSQGLTIEEMNRVCSWAQHEASVKERTILFDWDNTISTQNGYFSDDLENTDTGAGFNFNKMQMFKEVIPEDVIRLLMGTTERFDAIRNMFYILRKSGVNIFILSSNASTDFQNTNKKFNKTLFEYFFTLFKVIDPLIKESDFVYGLDKVAAFKAHPTLMKLYGNISHKRMVTPTIRPSNKTIKKKEKRI